MGFDLQVMSRKDLLELQAQVEGALKKAEAGERRAALKAAEQAAAEFGFSLAELSGGSGTKGTRSKSPARYRNPSNPDQTWSGMGRKPNWFHDAVANGSEVADLEI